MDRRAARYRHLLRSRLSPRRLFPSSSLPVRGALRHVPDARGRPAGHPAPLLRPDGGGRTPGAAGVAGPARRASNLPWSEDGTAYRFQTEDGALIRPSGRGSITAEPSWTCTRGRVTGRVFLFGCGTLESVSPPAPAPSLSPGGHSLPLSRVQIPPCGLRRGILRDFSKISVVSPVDLMYNEQQAVLQSLGSPAQWIPNVRRGNKYELFRTKHPQRLSAGPRWKW